MSAADAHPSPQIGDELDGRWRIVGVLGHGGHDVVWLGEHSTLGYPVAIKTLVPDPRTPLAASQRARLAEEAVLGARIDHPSIARVLDVGANHPRHPYIVTEFIDGDTLRAHLDRHWRLSVAQTVDLGRTLLAGLTALADAGVVHRDVKPSNIMLPMPGGPATAKLIDLGVARRIGPEYPELCGEGVVVGTPAYMAPEQLRAHAVDARADLYALGVVLFECLTGAAPRPPWFVERYLVDPTLEVEVVPPVRTLRPDCPSWLESIVRQATDPAQERRFASPAAMNEALGVLSADLGLPEGHRAWSARHLPFPASSERTPSPTRRWSQPSTAPTRPMTLATATAMSAVEAGFVR